MSLLDLIPGVSELKMALAIGGVVAITAGVGYVGYEIHEVKVLRAENAVLTDNNKKLQENLDVEKANFNVCKGANTVNEQTIGDLKQERADAQQAIATLAAEKQANLATLNELHAKLGNLIKDPKNNGPISVDLREVIRGIQNGEKK